MPPNLLWVFLRKTEFRYAALALPFGFNLGRNDAVRGASAGRAVLFNPIIPIYLSQSTWYDFDVGVAIVLAAHFSVRPVRMVAN
jgi:hypothetical protein